MQCIVDFASRYTRFATLVCLFLPAAPVVALSASPYERLLALKKSDPELYHFIQSLISYGNPNVRGGFSWSIVSTDIDCDESYQQGFSRCEVEFSIQSRSLAQSPDRRRARLEFECTASIRTTDANGYSSTDSESESYTAYISAGSSSFDSVEIDFSFYGSTPIVNVNLESAECDLQGIN